MAPSPHSSSARSTRKSGAASRRSASKEPGLLGEEDLMDAADALEPGSSAAMLLWEDIWAAELANALRAAGGELVTIGRIPHDVVMEAREALLAAAADSTQEG